MRKLKDIGGQVFSVSRRIHRVQALERPFVRPMVSASWLRENFDSLMSKIFKPKFYKDTLNWIKKTFKRMKIKLMKNPLSIHLKVQREEIIRIFWVG